MDKDISLINKTISFFTFKTRLNFREVSLVMAFTVSCRRCDKNFKTGYSLQKHHDKMHDQYQFDSGIFKDSQGQPLKDEPIPKMLMSEELASYKTWLALLSEQLCGSLSPNAKGKNVGMSIAAM